MTRSGSSGWLPRRSATTNAARSTTRRISEPSVSPAVQPAVSAWEKPKTMRKSPAQARTAPVKSIRGLLAGRVLVSYAPAPAARGDRAEDAEGPPPLARVLEGADQGAEGGRGEDRAEGALQRPGHHQHLERDGRTPDGRGDGESGQARDEDPLAAVHVAEPPADQPQAPAGH